MPPKDRAPAPVDNHPCAVCQPGGEVDDHPMIHIGANVTYVVSRHADGTPNEVILNPSVHFDCIPAEYERLLFDADGVTYPQHRNTVAAIEAARSGTRGADLRTFIHDYVKENGSDNEVGA